MKLTEYIYQCQRWWLEIKTEGYALKYAKNASSHVKRS